MPEETEGASYQLGQLLRPFWTTSYVLDGAHSVLHMGLLDQLENTVSGGTLEGQAFRAVYASKPAGRLACIDYLLRVTRQAQEMSGVRGLRPALRELSVELGATKNSRVRSWWGAALVLTQHDAPCSAITCICPSCDVYGTLYVRLDPRVAVCSNCGDTWSGSRFDELAVWVRWSRDHLSGPLHEGCYLCLEERATRSPALYARVPVIDTGAPSSDLL